MVKNHLPCLRAHLGIGMNGHKAVVDTQDHGKQALGGLALGLGSGPLPVGPGVEVRRGRVVLEVLLFGAARVLWERSTDGGGSALSLDRLAASFDLLVIS